MNCLACVCLCVFMIIAKGVFESRPAIIGAEPLLFAVPDFSCCSDVSPLDGDVRLPKPFKESLTGMCCTVYV